MTVRTLPFYKEGNISSGESITLDLMNDKLQGLGKRARGCMIKNVRNAGMTGILQYSIFNGNDWSSNISLEQGTADYYEFNDYILIEFVKLTALEGDIEYRVLAVPGIGE